MLGGRASATLGHQRSLAPCWATARPRMPGPPTAGQCGRALGQRWAPAQQRAAGAVPCRRARGLAKLGGSKSSPEPRRFGLALSAPRPPLLPLPAGRWASVCRGKACPGFWLPAQSARSGAAAGFAGLPWYTALGWLGSGGLERDGPRARRNFLGFCPARPWRPKGATPKDDTPGRSCVFRALLWVHPSATTLGPPRCPKDCARSAGSAVLGLANWRRPKLLLRIGPTRDLSAAASASRAALRTTCRLGTAPTAPAGSRRDQQSSKRRAVGLWLRPKPTALRVPNACYVLAPL